MDTFSLSPIERVQWSTKTHRSVAAYWTRGLTTRLNSVTRTIPGGDFQRFWVGMSDVVGIASPVLAAPTPLQKKIEHH